MEGNKIVSGYATTFEPYRLFTDQSYTIYEQIDRGAFNGCDMSDVVLLFDHSGNVLARTGNRTLELTIDNHGLKVDARLDGTQPGRDRYEEIKGKYLSQMSFAFIVEKDKREILEESAGHVTIMRTILKLKKILDVSVVTRPANPKTDISARALTAAEKEWMKKVIKFYSEVE